jgi:hypothetical protein
MFKLEDLNKFNKPYIKDTGCRVEWRASDGGVDVVLGSNRVGSEEPNKVVTTDTGISKACDDGGNSIRRQGKEIGRGSSNSGRTSNEGSCAIE